MEYFNNYPSEKSVHGMLSHITLKLQRTLTNFKLLLFLTQSYHSGLSFLAGAVAQSVRVFSQQAKVGCSNPAATEQSRKTGSNIIDCQTLDKRCVCPESSEMAIINGCLVSQQYGSRMVPGKKMFYLAATTYYVAAAT